MARKKRHHTVTRTLLEGFSLDQKLRVRSRSRDEFLTSPVNATVVSDFYSFQGEDQLDDAVEEWLNKDVETPFAALLPDLRAGNQPSSLDRSVIVRFIATAVVRTRTTRAYLGQIDLHIAATVVLQTVAPRMGWNLSSMSSENIEKLLVLCESLWLEVAQEANQELSLLRTMVRHSQIVETALGAYAWKILQASGPRFLIGDAPILSVSDHKSGWHGLIPEQSAVFMPIAPDTILVGEPRSTDRFLSADDLAMTINSLTVREAYADVFRHPDMAWPDGIRLEADVPQLPVPSRVLRPAPPGTPSTFPSTYPEVSDAGVADLLKRLQAVDTVD